MIDLTSLSFAILVFGTCRIKSFKISVRGRGEGGAGGLPQFSPKRLPPALTVS